MTTSRTWLGDLPGPVAVAYEAGPTGFGLYRHLMSSGVRCEVVAPSKLQKPAGDRVKTDARDALHLARLLRLDEITAVAIPTLDQEAARDLVRAREDARGDLMRARHRLSKLLLRYGIVYYGGKAWTGKHDAWLRHDALDQLTATGGRSIRATFDNDYDALLTTLARRDRLDVLIEQMAADSRVHPGRAPVGVPAWDRHPDRVRAGRRGRRLAPVHRRSIGSFVGLVPTEHSSGQSRAQGRSPRPATATPAGCWSRLPGTTARPTGHRRPCTNAGPWPPRPHGCVAMKETDDSTSGGSSSSTARSDTRSRPPRSPANWPAGAGHLRSSTTPPTPGSHRRPRAASSAPAR